jgi:hypothetical protein
MKTIVMRGDDSHYVGLSLDNWKEKEIVGKSHLDRLQPYVSSFIDSEPSLETARGKLKVVVLSDTQAAFSIGGHEADVSELLSKICDICKVNLTERLIVPQFMGDKEATIKHRVMQFEVDKSQILVNYATLGHINDFDAAMQEIAEMYPGVWEH